MDTFKKAVSSIKDRIVKTPLERSILEACSDENWGSANTVLHEISEKTFSHEDRQVIMKLLWELLKSPAKEWRRLYKVLNLIDHLIKFGSTACLHEIQDEAFKIRMMQDFSFREGAEEKGIGVRDKAKYISSMLGDRKVLEEEREKAKKTWSKFTGISSGDSYGMENMRGGYDSYNQRRVEDGYQGGGGGYQDRRFDDRREERVQEEKRNETYEVKDIFKEPEIKVVKLQQKETVWDKEPGKLPSAPKGIRPPPSSANPSNIFDPVQVKKVTESKPANIAPSSAFTSEPSFPQTQIYSPSPQPQPSPSPVSFPVAPGAYYPSNPPTSHQPVSFPSAPIHISSPNPVSHTALPGQTFAPAGPSVGLSYQGGSYTSPANPVNPMNPINTMNPMNPMNPIYPVYPNNPLNPANPSNPNSHLSLPGSGYPSNAGMNLNNGVLTAGSTNPTYPGSSLHRAPAPAYSPGNLAGLNYSPQPAPGNPGPSGYSANSYAYPQHSNSSGLVGLNLGQAEPDYSSNTNNSGQRVHANLGGGFSMEDMKKLGGSGFSNFQSAPAEPAKVDLESKLMNLDNLEAGQPRIKEIAKSRW